jgi:hypothetical protein
LDWILAANNSPWSKFHSNSKFQEESIINSVELKPRNFPEFSFQSPSESEKVSMEKFVHLFEIFKTIFYLIFWSSGMSILDRSKIGKISTFLNWSGRDPAPPPRRVRPSRAGPTLSMTHRHASIRGPPITACYHHNLAKREGGPRTR